MILTASEIIKERDAGNIVIDPFDEKNLGPNSYDVHLAGKLCTYNSLVLDAGHENPTQGLPFDDFVMLHPGTLYLAQTVERFGSTKFVPCLEGRSSLARLGLSIHQTAGFGDLGYVGVWTLEITVVHPTFVYEGMRIGQVCFHEVKGDIDRLYQGKYNGATTLQASKCYEDREFK